MVFMMDQSLSIRHEELGGHLFAFKYAKEVIIKIATELRAELEAGEVSIGVIDFGITASVVVPLNHVTTNVDAFVAAVDAIKYQGQQPPH